MSRGDSLRPALAWAVGLALWLAMQCCSGAARAQSDELLVARVCYSEGGADPHECRAVAHVLSQRARYYGGSVRTAAQAYAPRATGRQPYVGREWIAALDPDETPAVEGVNRELMRVRFAAIVVVAWRALRGLDEAVCPRALHWSAPWCSGCRDRMGDAGMVRLPCNAANHLWGWL